MTIRQHVTLLVVLLFIAGALFLISKDSSIKQDGSGALTASEQEKLEEKRIKRLGGKAAYDALAREVEGAAESEKHFRAHAFGAALFSMEGVGGLSVCDNKFSYGCFHEFLGRAIAHLGLDSVIELNQNCYDSLGAQYLACQHGIGHGVLSAVGYEEKDLIQALQVCKDVPYSELIGGCYGGVFMEYNTQTMLAEQARVREFKGDWLAPCNSLDSAFVKACYYWQPQWWNIVLKNAQTSEADIYTRMGQFCERLAGDEERRMCFEGVGNVAPSASNFEPIATAKLCELTSDVLLHQLYCKSIAANSLGAGGGRDSKIGGEVCATLDGRSKDYCLAYARNDANALMRLDPTKF